MNHVDFEIEFKTNFFSRKKVISFSKALLSLKYENEIITLLDKGNIKDFRFGIEWIRGIDFIIGRIYCVDVSDRNGNILKIRLRSLYGVNSKKLHAKYVEIIEKLYEYYFDDIISSHVNNVLNGFKVDINGVIFTETGICWDSNSFVNWINLDLKEYTYYFSLFSKDNPSYYKAFTYISDWNSVVIYAVSKLILKEKGSYKGV